MLTDDEALDLKRLRRLDRAIAALEEKGGNDAQ